MGDTGRKCNSIQFNSTRNASIQGAKRKFHFNNPAVEEEGYLWGSFSDSVDRPSHKELSDNEPDLLCRVKGVFRKGVFRQTTLRLFRTESSRAMRKTLTSRKSLLYAMFECV